MAKQRGILRVVEEFRNDGQPKRSCQIKHSKSTLIIIINNIYIYLRKLNSMLPLMMDYSVFFIIIIVKCYYYYHKQ